MPEKALDEYGRLEYTDAHDDHFGTGNHHNVHLKTLLLHIAKNLDTMFDNGNAGKRVEFKKEGRGAELWSVFRNRTFKELTGFDYRCINKYKTEITKNNGYLLPAGYEKKRGRPKLQLQLMDPGLEQWLKEQARQANKGGFLTAKRLIDKYQRTETATMQGPVQPGQQRPQFKVSEKVFRRALHALHFRYTVRRYKRLEARESARILAHLDRVLKWFKENTHYVWSDIAGKAVWKFIPPVGFMDESYMQAGEYRSRSWTNIDTRTREQLKKSCRLVLLHTIFSHRNDKLPCKYWSAEWKKAHSNYDYFGRCNSDTMRDYFQKIFAALLPANPVGDEQPNVVFCDNASMHKRIRDELRGTPEEIIDWITDNNDEIDQALQDTIEAMHASAPGHSPERKDLLNALQNGGVEIFELNVLAKDYNTRIMWLPPYYSELNPIELLWCEIKRYYRDCTDTNQSWEVRMKEAVDSITPAFIESCFDRSIRWALRKYNERFPPAPADAPPAPALAPAPAAAEELDLGDEEEADEGDEALFDELFQEEMHEQLEVEEAEAADEEMYDV